MTIGVWVGRPDGAPVPGLVGRGAAAPILFDAFARTGKLPMALPKPPKGALLASNAKIAAAAAPVPSHRRADPDRRRAGAPHPVPARWLAHLGRSRGRSGRRRDAGEGGRGVLPITMLVNGTAVGEIDGRRQRLIDPPGPGICQA